MLQSSSILCSDEAWVYDLRGMVCNKEGKTKGFRAAQGGTNLKLLLAALEYFHPYRNWPQEVLGEGGFFFYTLFHGPDF